VRAALIIWKMTVFQRKVLNILGIFMEKSNEYEINLKNKGTRQNQNEFTKRKQGGKRVSSPILLYT